MQDILEEAKEVRQEATAELSPTPKLSPIYAIQPRSETVGYYKTQPNIPEPEYNYEATTFEKMSAVFNQNNTLGQIGSIAGKIYDGWGEVDENFRVTDEDMVKVPEQYWSWIVEAKSPAHLNSIYNRINKDIEDKQIVDSIGFTGSIGYNIVAGLVDPTNYLPAVAFFKSAKASKSMVANMLAIGPDALVSNAAFNATRYVNKDVADVQTAIQDTIQESIMGTLVAGSISAGIQTKSARELGKTVLDTFGSARTRLNTILNDAEEVVEVNAKTKKVTAKIVDEATGDVAGVYCE